jgi:hypothetical protein
MSAGKWSGRVLLSLCLGVCGGAGPGASQGVAHWDEEFGVPGMNGTEVHELEEYENGVVACGEFTMAGGGECNGVAYWDGSAWHPLGTGVNGRASSLAILDGRLYVAGTFSQAGETPGTTNIACWDGVAWQSVGGGLNDIVYGLTVYKGQLVAGGRFTLAGTTPVNYVACWDGTEWQPMGEGFTEGTPLPTVWSFAEYGGDLIAGGRFSRSGSTVVNRVAKWTGEEWLPLGEVSQDTPSSL